MANKAELLRFLDSKVFNPIISAKKEETRARRLATLIEDSANERRARVVTLEKKA